MPWDYMYIANLKISPQPSTTFSTYYYMYIEYIIAISWAKD